MQISSCPKCNKKGSLIFTTTKRNGRRYSYVQHYDPRTKSKKKCHIRVKDLVRIKFDERWYRVYEIIITIMQVMCDVCSKPTDHVMRNQYSSPRVYGLNGVAALHPSILEAAGNMLEKHGYLKYRISEKIMWDVINPEPKDWEKAWNDIQSYNFVNTRREREFGNDSKESLPLEDMSTIKAIWEKLLPDRDFPQNIAHM